MAEERVERRLAAILAADMVGYSRLMEVDEAGTLAALKAHRAQQIDPEIAAHKGRIVKTTGDGLLAEFASVVDAVAGAAAIQRAMAERNKNVPGDRRIEFRIGVNLGDIIIDGDDIYGDGVNIAARLEGLAEPGGICVSGAAYEQLKAKVEVGYEDLGERRVKNIEKPVRVYRVLLEPEAAGRAVVAVRTRLRRWKWPATTAITIVVVLLMAGYFGVFPIRGPDLDMDLASGENSPFKLPDKPSIAVLPFSNMSGDPEQEYFADGITEDIITELSKFQQLFVIARNSSFNFKDQPADAREVASQLGVRYVLKGTIRRSEETLRITAQLIDADTGTNLWARRYDRPLSEIFAVQDEVIQEIVATLASSVKRADLSRAARIIPNELTAYDLVLRAHELTESSLSQQSVLEARVLLTKAIEIDPLFAQAYVRLGRGYYRGSVLQWDGPEALDKAYELAQRAIALDSSSASAYDFLGRIYLRRRQHDTAIATQKKALSLNPNRADSYSSLANTLTFAGDAKEAVELVKKAMRLDPFYPPIIDMYLGRALYFDKRYEKAVPPLETCAARAPKFRACYMFLAPAYAELGLPEEARRVVARLLEVAPNFTINGSVRTHLPFVADSMQHYIQGLQKAGVPE
jgi:adenylate cyclase